MRLHFETSNILVIEGYKYIQEGNEMAWDYYSPIHLNHVIFQNETPRDASPMDPQPLHSIRPQNRLIKIQIALMRMLKTVLGHQRRSTNPTRHQVLPKVQNPLRQLIRPFIPILIPVPTPHKLRQGRRPRPEFLAEDHVVDLFGPEGRDGAHD